MSDQTKTKMTLDELIDGLDLLRIKGVKSDCDYINYIHDNRAALEAGMQKPLIFHRNAMDTAYLLINREYQTNYVIGGKAECLALAESQGLPAEFVEDTK